MGQIKALLIELEDLKRENERLTDFKDRLLTKAEHEVAERDKEIERLEGEVRRACTVANERIAAKDAEIERLRERLKLSQEANEQLASAYTERQPIRDRSNNLERLLDEAREAAREGWAYSKEEWPETYEHACRQYPWLEEE